MGRVRVCGNRCHNARGKRCHCWCGGFFHGKDGVGVVNREALQNAERNFLEQHGFKKGATVYIEQKKMPM